MNEILDRVKSNLQCCAIQLLFDGDTLPSAIEGWQPFYNSIYTGELKSIYASISSIDFTEETIQSPSGYYSKQKIKFQFPATDKNRSQRIEILKKIKYIIVVLDNKERIIIGRNDFFQNAKPNIKISTNHQLAGVEIETQSISPAGFVVNSSLFGLPTLVPLTFIPTS